MNNNNGTRYEDDFKKMIVNLYNAGNHTYASLESEYGVKAGSIQRWVKQYTPINPTEKEPVTPDDLIKLQKEMAKLKEENEILKRAMTIKKNSKTSLLETASILSKDYNIKTIC